MAKREGDMFLEGPPSKMLKEDTDDSGGGRAGRVRKKSAKVLEMEEFEKFEKVKEPKPVKKPAKSPKVPATPTLLSPEKPVTTTLLKSGGSAKKVKHPKAVSGSALPMDDSTPLPPKISKSKLAFKIESDLKMKLEMAGVGSPGLQQSITPLKMETSPSVAPPAKMKITPTGVSVQNAPVVSKIMSPPPAGKQDDKSVIKYLLNSPSSGSQAAGNAPSPVVSPPVDPVPVPVKAETSTKKAKKPKASPQEKSAAAADKATPKPKAAKPKKSKKESSVSGMSGSEDIGMSQSGSDISGLDVPTPSLKMKIVAGPDPSSALVMAPQPAKKKTKKAKQELNFDTDTSPGLLSGISQSDSDGDAIKKKSSKKSIKKNEKLIQDAITAAKTPLPVSPPGPSMIQAAQMSSTFANQESQKMPKKQKKKTKSSSPIVSGGSPSDSALMSEMSFDEDVMSDYLDDDDDDDAEDEISLVIAETESKKKKTVLKKKASTGKSKSPSSSSKKDKDGDKEKDKAPKRAPTAYMLFCNTHRPQIVNDNPGIEFAAISRKLGEAWQVLSNKQKLAWRRKAQKRVKKGSNMVSTGKVPKESAAPQTVSHTTTHTGHPADSQLVAHGSRTAVVVQRSPRSGMEDVPMTPTLQNFSIEPIDVAAHLKLLGESLSIIGMRLQEHKGMIAVQGSLSVLLDSLLCATGPLLALTQQIPGMDGCHPLVHAETLDSVAYVMPGL